MNKILMCVYNEIDNDGRVIRSAEALSDKFNVTIVSSSTIDNTVYINKIFKNIFITKKYKGILSLIHFYITFIGIILENHKNIDMVYLHDYYLPIIYFIKKFINKDIVFIYDAHELIIKEDNMNMRAKFFYLIEKYTIDKFDLVVAANYERAKIMQNHYNLDKLPLAIRNITNTKYREKTKIKKDTITVLYQGYVSYERGLENLINSMKYLPEKFNLLIIGDGPDLYKIKDFKKKYLLEDRITCTGKIKLSELNEAMSFADIGFVSYSYKGLNNINCSPNKIYEYASVGLPMIATDQPVLINYFEQYQLGKVMNKNVQENPEILSELIIEMSNELDIHDEKLKFFLNDNSWVKESEKLIENVMKL
jgi:glycogen synthase